MHTLNYSQLKDRTIGLTTNTESLMGQSVSYAAAVPG